MSRKAEDEADIFFVKVSLGAMFIVADTKSSGKGVGIEFKIIATTEKKNPALSGNVTVTGAAIYYAYWDEVGVKGEDSEEVENEVIAGNGQFAGAANTSSTVKKNVKDETKWTEIFTGWTWPKEDKNGDTNKRSATSISNIND